METLSPSLSYPALFPLSRLRERAGVRAILWKRFARLPSPYPLPQAGEGKEESARGDVLFATDVRHRQPRFLQHRERLIDHVRIAAKIRDVMRSIRRELAKRDVHAPVAIVRARHCARHAAEACVEGETR